MTTTTTTDAIGGITRYDGQVYRVFFADGEFNEYGVNADNAAHQWVVETTFSMYQGRCQSYLSTEIPGLVFPAASRDDARRAMCSMLSAGAVK